MRLSLLIATILLVFLACAKKPEPVKTPAQPVVHTSKQNASPWFDEAKRLHNQVCLTTPNGMDIRQAAFFQSANDADYQVLTRIRDYVDRKKGQPDDQWLVLYSPVTGMGKKLIGFDGVFPERFVVSTDHTRLCLGGITQGEDGSFSGNASLTFWDAGNEAQVIPLSGPAIVQRFTAEGAVVCLEIPAAGLSGGLLAPAIDWKAPLQKVVPPGLTPDITLPTWETGPSSKNMAKLSVVFDAAQPVEATVQVELRTIGQTPEFFQHAFPYHVTYAPLSWEPQSKWADGSTIIIKEFLPNPTSKQSRANHRGVFRLVAYSTSDMQRTLIADHVEASLGFVAANKLVFYTLRRPGKEAESWEVWVASIDGLNKRLVWRTGDVQYLSVADYLPAGRLLVERQFFTEKDGRPQLHSELREISLKPVERSPTAVAPEDVVERILNGTQAPLADPDSGKPTLGIPPRISTSE